MKFAEKKKSKKLATQGLDSSAIKLTTKTVSKEDLIEDYAILAYNIKQLEAQLTEKRVLRIYKKICTNPFSADSEYPLKGDLEQLLFLNLEELRATTTIMIEVMYSDLKAQEDEKKK